MFQLKATDSRYKDFKPAEAWKSLGVPVHPGAEKYYGEKGCVRVASTACYILYAKMLISIMGLCAHSQIHSPIQIQYPLRLDMTCGGNF